MSASALPTPPAIAGLRLTILSDVHWAGIAEAARAGHESRVVQNPALRLAARLWRRWIWLAVPHAHNHRLPAMLARAGAADLVLANGDFTLDTAFVGVSDDAACASAAECLGHLRASAGTRLRTIIGDHELGKLSLFGGAGGLRRRSLERCESELGLARFWTEELPGRWLLMGVTSTLVAWPMFAPETPADEHAWWQEQHVAHRAQIAQAFADVRPEQRVLLCCHDPSALAFLHELPEVRARLGQIAATFIGHLHSPAIFAVARRMAGFPRIPWLGATARRYTTALSRAGCWGDFQLALCPSLAGLQCLKDGGWLSVELGAGPPTIKRHRLPWDLPATEVKAEVNVEANG